jgi:predicted nuclease of restriction endonuclease-like RecB superfamily
MLPPELVRARRRGDSLELQKFPTAERRRALEMAEELLAFMRGAEGMSLDEVTELLGAVDRTSKEEKLFLGLKKLLLDEAEFGAAAVADPVALRRALFGRASQARRELAVGASLDRAALLAEVAQGFDITVAAAEEGLFSDSKGAALLTRVPGLAPVELVERYELAQLQGVLLRAVRVTVRLCAASPEVYRSLFRKLKFRQLLYRLSREEPGYRIEIDGPFSVIESTTRYGLQLALLVPALLECDEVELEAELRWGKERKSLAFRQALRGAASPLPAPLRPELDALVAETELGGGLTVRPSSELLDVPGLGLIAPDLVFEREGRPPVHMELLGYWSREAVWKRVEWAERATAHRVLFAASSRLRVKQEVLDDRQSSALYVFKGTMSRRAILDKVHELMER